MINRWVISLFHDNYLISSNNYLTHVYIYRRLYTTLLATLSLLFLQPTSSSAQSSTTYVKETLKETVHISFPEGSANLLPDYKDNQNELGRINVLLGELLSDGTITIERLILVGYASPEGRYSRNDYLARTRTEQLKKYLSSHLAIAPERIVTRYEAEDWAGLATFAEQATTAQMPNRDKVIEVARSAMDPDEKERIISSEYPNDFLYLLIHCMPVLRRTDWILEYQVEQPSKMPWSIVQSKPAAHHGGGKPSGVEIGKSSEANTTTGVSQPANTGVAQSANTGTAQSANTGQPATAGQPANAETSQSATAGATDAATTTGTTDTSVSAANAASNQADEDAPTATDQETSLSDSDAEQPISPFETTADHEATSSDADQEDRPFYWMLKTNMLYDLGATPNVGIEVSIGHRWTIAAEWLYAWWKSNSRHRYWQGYGGYLSVRKYFGRSADDHPFTGHHLGAYGSALTYDVEWGGRGYQATRFGFGGGLEYGYSIALTRRLNLDFSLGLGFQDGMYKEYDPIDTHYVWQSTHKRHWWGPTKADISLVWLLGRGNLHKKGGLL